MTSTRESKRIPAARTATTSTEQKNKTRPTLQRSDNINQVDRTLQVPCREKRKETNLGVDVDVSVSGSVLPHRPELELGPAGTTSTPSSAVEHRLLRFSLVGSRAVGVAFGLDDVRFGPVTIVAVFPSGLRRAEDVEHNEANGQQQGRPRKQSAPKVRGARKGGRGGVRRGQRENSGPVVSGTGRSAKHKWKNIAQFHHSFDRFGCRGRSEEVIYIGWYYTRAKGRQKLSLHLSYDSYGA